MATLSLALEITPVRSEFLSDLAPVLRHQQAYRSDTSDIYLRE
jgi:hypothetical protein